jgi:putative ABC transport system permease protein
MTGGVDELAAVLGHDASRYAPTLDHGGAVVPFATATNGTVALTSKPPTAKAAPGHVVVPAVSVRADEPQVLFLSPAAAAKLGAPVSTIGIIAPASVPPTKAQEDRARGALAGIDPDIGFALQVERGYQANDGLGLLALVVGSAIIVLGASGIATGLAAADGRADLATLAAVGASPGRRRSLAAFQSAVTAGLGTVLGTIAGLVPAAGMVRALNQQLRHDRTIARPYPFVVPWHNLAVTVILVPLLAAGAAALLTRSRLPMLRRVG